MGGIRYNPKGCSLYYRLITSVLGIIIAVSAGVAFALEFKNYHCAGWGLFSGIFALITLWMHVRVYRDVAYSIQPVTFERLKYIGFFGMIAGFGVFVGYCIKGILVKETGIVVRGWFIVMVWGYMTWKWGFLLAWYAHKYRKALIEEVKGIFQVNQSNEYDA